MPTLRTRRVGSRGQRALGRAAFRGGNRPSTLSKSPKRRPASRR